MDKEHFNKLKELLKKNYNEDFSDNEVYEIGTTLIKYFDILSRNSRE